MDYIDAEEFLKQPRAIQKTFEKWWTDNLQQSDLVKLKLARNKEKIQIIANIDLACTEEGEIIPLLTEGQLRKFIEDKTCGISSMYNKCNNIAINIYNNNSPIFVKKYENLGSDLLQAYWKVALEIAKEEN